MASGSSSKSLKKHSDEVRKKKTKSKSKPNSKSKSKSSKRRRRDSSLSSYSSAESDSDDYRRKKKKLKPNKPEKKGKEATKKTHKKKRRRRHSPSSSSCDTCHSDESRSPARRPKSKKRYRYRSLSRTPGRSCSTCSVRSGDRGGGSIRGRSPRRPKSHFGTKDRSRSRDTRDKAYDDRCEETEPATEVVLVKDDLAMEKSVGVDVGDNTGKDANDMELILRQKALENFMKFRGRISASKESVDEIENEAVTPIVEEERWNPNSTGTLDQLNSGALSIGEKKAHVIRTSSYQDKRRNAFTKEKDWNPNSIETSKPTVKPVVSSSIGGTSRPRPNHQPKNVQGSLRTTLAKVAQEKKLVEKPGYENVHSSAVSIGDRRDKAIGRNSGNDNQRNVPGEEIVWNPNSKETSKRVGKPMVSSSSGEGSIPMPDQLKNVQGSTNGMLLEQTTLTEVAQDKKLGDKTGGAKVRVGAARIGDRKDEATGHNINDKQKNLMIEERDLNPNSTRTSKPAGSTLEGRSMPLPNQLRGVQVSSNKMSSEQTTLVGESGGEKANTGVVSVGNESALMASVPIKDNENCKANEPVVGSASGSQFEKKSFCRVHDGETVQVKYKVYIPTETPALARRKQQR